MEMEKNGLPLHFVNGHCPTRVDCSAGPKKQCDVDKCLASCFVPEGALDNATFPSSAETIKMAVARATAKFRCGCHYT